MDRYRLIAGIVVCFIYLLALYPVQTIAIGIALAIAYFILSNMGPGRVGEYSAIDNGREIRRRQALSKATIYLAPYNSIWSNLKLSNKYCSLRLQANGRTIVGRETVNLYRTFRISNSRVHSDEELWNMFCNKFDHNTTFDNLIELCAQFQADINIENYYTANNSSKNNYNNSYQVDVPKPTVPEIKQEKLDINNASEVELTALPGISIVVAKKIIKRREEINGFKNVNEFLQFTQLKPHMQTQLRELICVNKMKGSINIKRYNERSVDL